MLEELEEAHLETRKGTWCVFAAVFCQEGICSACELPVEFFKDLTRVGQTVSRDAHNVEIDGSTPSPATIDEVMPD